MLGEVHCGCSVSDNSGSSDGVARGDAMAWLVGARQEQISLQCLAIRRPFGMHGSTVREALGRGGGHKEEVLLLKRFVAEKIRC